MFCSNCGKSLPDGSTFCAFCGEKLSSVPTSQQPQVIVVSTNKVEPVVAWILFVFLGGFGIHRFYLGGRHVGWGIAYLLTGAFCGIGWLIDLFCLSGWIAECNTSH